MERLEASRTLREKNKRVETLLIRPGMDVFLLWFFAIVFLGPTTVVDPTWKKLGTEERLVLEASMLLTHKERRRHTAMAALLGGVTRGFGRVLGCRKDSKNALQ